MIKDSRALCGSGLEIPRSGQSGCAAHARNGNFCCVCAEPFPPGAGAASPHKDLGDEMGARELSDGARHVLTFYYVRLDAQVSCEAHVTLDGFVEGLGRGYVNGQAIGAQIVRHALAAADEDGGRRVPGKADEDALAFARGHEFLFHLVGGVADGEFAERGEVGLGEEVVERAVGFFRGVDDAALDAACWLAQSTNCALRRCRSITLSLVWARSHWPSVV